MQPCEERLREPGIFCLEKKRLKADMIGVFTYLKDCHKEEGKQLFSFATKDRT